MRSREERASQMAREYYSRTQSERLLDKHLYKQKTVRGSTASD